MEENQNNKEQQRHQTQLEKKRERSLFSRMNEAEEERQNRLEKEKNRSQSIRTNETKEQRQNRLEKNMDRNRSDRMIETEEERQNRLEKNMDRNRSDRMIETEEERQNRLEKNMDRNRSDRMIETEEERQNRLEKEKNRIRSNRTNETEEQNQRRLDQQKQRSKANRASKKAQKRSTGILDGQEQNTDLQTVEIGFDSCDSTDTNHSIPNEISSRGRKKSVHTLWPEPISRTLKETCLQKFIKQMSMSELAEVSCAVCNVRISVQNSKKVPLSKIPNIHLLKVSDEFKNLIRSIQSSNTERSNVETLPTSKNNNTSTSRHNQSNRFTDVIFEFFDDI